MCQASRSSPQKRAKGPSAINSRLDGVAPLWVEPVASEVDGCQLGVADGDRLGVLGLVEVSVDLEAGACGGRADQSRRSPRG